MRVRKYHRINQASEILSLDFSPVNPDILASGSGDGTVKVWDLGSRSKVVANMNFKSGINSVTWNNNSTCLAAGTAIGEIAVGSVRAGFGHQQRSQSEAGLQTSKLQLGQTSQVLSLLRI